mmetsp:Transcript_18920/g.56382  ORF Transcript_18920/g.56382 Transcript_18920/m.56382 type:complete len:88 (-) Transcript_18920:917-1180(-)|eukprot:363506-Chlamydomonas_euryale.AAC.1
MSMSMPSAPKKCSKAAGRSDGGMCESRQVTSRVRTADAAVKRDPQTAPISHLLLHALRVASIEPVETSASPLQRFDGAVPTPSTPRQ